MAFSRHVVIGVLRCPENTIASLAVERQCAVIGIAHVLFAG